MDNSQFGGSCSELGDGANSEDEFFSDVFRSLREPSSQGSGPSSSRLGQGQVTIQPDEDEKVDADGEFFCSQSPQRGRPRETTVQDTGLWETESSTQDTATPPSSSQFLASDASSDDCEEPVPVRNTAAPKYIFLVTYSQVDRSVFATKAAFADAVVKAFNAGRAESRVESWACSVERHQDGVRHYHMCLRMTKGKKWLHVKKLLERQHRIVVNFREIPADPSYIRAYRYVTKEDGYAVHSDPHPDIADMDAPVGIMHALKVFRSNAADRAALKCEVPSLLPVKVKRLSRLDLFHFICSRQIRNSSQFEAKAMMRAKQGNEDVLSFYLCHIKEIASLVETSWRVMEAPTKEEQKKRTRIETIANSLLLPCVESCEARQLWFRCATEVIINNGYTTAEIGGALRESLLRGRGKYLNPLFVGNTNCGKSFIIKPLEVVFPGNSCFLAPANDKFGWLGVEQCEVVLLQDFRISECANWNTLLLLLEGETVKFPAPKNQFSCDICLRGGEDDCPVFATTGAIFDYQGKLDKAQQEEMMSVRWNTFHFKWQIPKAQQLKLSPCARCFAKLVMVQEKLEDSQ